MSKKQYQVIETDSDQLERKIRSHRLRILKVILAFVILILIVAASFYYVYETTTYTQYQVLESRERWDSAGTRFATFGEYILKYSNDGVVCTDEQNQVIWNQAYEMQMPMLDICESYVAVADQKGKKIYIMDQEGPCGEIDTNRAIAQLCVANQGVVAVLMEDKGTGYIELYDREGNYLAEGQLHTQKAGYPLSIALSNDGRKMAVSMLDVNEGKVKSTVAFYNFGSVGQNEIDNIVSSYPYSDVVIPRITFLSNDVAVAVGDTRLVFYEGSQKPQSVAEVELEREIRSVFYDENHVGIVFRNEGEGETYCVELYDTKGNKIRTFDFSMDYDTIEFLENDEICILNQMECAIYSLRGKVRFHANFEEDIYQVLHEKGHRYIFLKQGVTEKIVLK